MDAVKGRRLDVVLVDGKPDLNACMPHEPGDYVGPIVGYTGDKPALFYVLPNHPAGATPRHITFPPHSCFEQADGSLTVTPSIEHTGEPYYHGYLTAGEWTDA